MTPKTVLILGAVTAVSLAAAVATSLHSGALSTVQLSNEPAFPALHAAPDAVARVEIRSASQSFSLARTAEGPWRLPKKHDYPVAADKLRELIVTLSDMRLVEAKTRLPERHGRLQVEDIEDEGAKSLLLRLKTADGKTLAAALLGKRSNRYVAGQDKGTYLRKPGEDQAWLASGYVRVATKPEDWLAKEIVHLPGEQVAWVEVTPQQGQGYRAARATATDTLALDAVPEGRKVKADALGRLPSALAQVQLQDVKPAAELDLTASPGLVKVRRFDGLEVTVQLNTIEEQTWTTFEAAYAGAAGSEDEAAKAAQADVAKINDRVGGWAYLLENYVAERLKQPLDGLLEDDKTS